MNPAPLWIGGSFRPSADGLPGFRAFNPETGRPISGEYPTSGLRDLDTFLDAASGVAPALAAAPAESIARFLEGYASRIESRAVALSGLAYEETALPVRPRLFEVELPRTLKQLREGARIARSRNWREPVIDTGANLRTLRGPLGKPVVIFSPNNFPFAFNALSGSDFVSACVAQNPVLAKAHPGHPHVTEALADLAQEALAAAGLPPGSIQLCYGLDETAGFALVGDRRVGAVCFTGSRTAGLALKAHADSAGIPFFGEFSSTNPVFILPGALAERGEALASEIATSCLMGSGQFCTKPGLLVLPACPGALAWLETLTGLFASAPPATLLAAGVRDRFEAALARWERAGARRLGGGGPVTQAGFRVSPALFGVDARTFLANPGELETEAFGPAALVVHDIDPREMPSLAARLEGQLTATLLSDHAGADEALYTPLASVLRTRAGRLLNDKMPTGVLVSPAMNHGGPFPATNQPGFTSVGLPGAIRRLTMLYCYDNVRPDRLPDELGNPNPVPGLWRLVDGNWISGDID
jgi:NADP-dependent aldehyde dehydrogenase